MAVQRVLDVASIIISGQRIFNLRVKRHELTGLVSL
jgi:hypothetical protein